MPEWSIGPHSKCGVGATLPGVRIPLFPQPATPPFGGLLLSKGKSRSTTLRADRGKQKRSSEAARCGLLVPPSRDVQARSAPSILFFRNPQRPPLGGFCFPRASQGQRPCAQTEESKSGAAKLRVAGCWSPPPGMYKRAARRQSSFSATRNAPYSPCPKE